MLGLGSKYRRLPFRAVVVGGDVGSHPRSVHRDQHCPPHHGDHQDHLANHPPHLLPFQRYLWCSTATRG
ncbi:hypothetical protein T484DRAFT_1960088, partial [Baffinella frigidus]